MRHALPILFLASLASGLHADVTVRYRTEMKGSLQAMMQQASPQVSSLMPQETKLLIKGSKSYNQFGGTFAISDSSTKEFIVLDQVNKKYAVTTPEEYFRSIKTEMPAMPPMVTQMLATLQTKVDSKLTGQTETIKGIESAEREITISVEGPAMPNMPPGPMIRLVIHIWSATPAAIEKSAALRELVAFNQNAAAGLSSNAGMKQLFDMVPGITDKLGPVLQEMSKPGNVMTRVHCEMFMPALAAMMKQMPAGSSPVGEIDPKGSLMNVNVEIAELSTDAIPDSQFQPPAEYQKQPIDEFMKAYLARLKAPAK
jgi:hypothetical protein